MFNVIKKYKQKKELEKHDKSYVNQTIQKYLWKDYMNYCFNIEYLKILKGLDE